MEPRIIKTGEQHRRYLEEARRRAKVDPAPGSDDDWAPACAGATVSAA
jgi:hypothetical protein